MYFNLQADAPQYAVIKYSYNPINFQLTQKDKWFMEEHDISVALESLKIRKQREEKVQKQPIKIKNNRQKRVDYVVKRPDNLKRIKDQKKEKVQQNKYNGNRIKQNIGKNVKSIKSDSSTSLNSFNQQRQIKQKEVIGKNRNNLNFSQQNLDKIPKPIINDSKEKLDIFNKRELSLNIKRKSFSSTSSTSSLSSFNFAQSLRTKKTIVPNSKRIWR